MKVTAVVLDSIGGPVRRGAAGRENGIEGLRALMQTKSVWLAANPMQPDPFSE